MSGADVMQESLFTYMTLNDFVPANHPLKPIREIVNTALKAMDATFGHQTLDNRLQTTDFRQQTSDFRL